MKFVVLTLLVILSISMLPSLPSFALESSVISNVHTVVITGDIYDWGMFRAKLRELKRIGVDAIKAGIPWSYIEPHKGIYDWSWPKEYFESVAEAGLLWIPTLAVSFVPSWVWEDYPDAKFVNEFNETSEEYMSFWHPQTRPLIHKYYSEFFAEFSDYNEAIYGFYVSAGMWSELIYPWIPEEGRNAYWGYDPYAKADFRNEMRIRYATIETANQWWGTSFSDWTEVSPPLPDTSHKKMWSDFLGWYNSTLVEHGDWVLNLMRTYYDGWVGINLPMLENEEVNLKLGHLDYDAIFSTIAKYNAIPTYTSIETYETSIRFSNMAEKYNLDAWGENALEGANLQTVFNNLRYGNYEVFCYLWIQDLFDDWGLGNPTSRFYELANFITQWDPAPVAIFEHTSPIAKEPTTFNASGSAPIGGTIINYKWDFGDNTTTTVTNPIVTHTYNKAGNYTVTLNITDSQGYWNTGYKHITVKSPDVNGDGSVNVRDFIVVAKAFGAWPARYNWNPSADINSDDMVNVTDLRLVANYFEQSVDLERTRYNSAVDFNSDAVVNSTDMIAMADAFGSVPSNPN